jgi:hypothetical protein
MHRSRLTQSRKIWLLIICIALVGDESIATSYTCSELVLEDETDLDTALKQSQFAFVASVVVNDTDDFIFDYVLHPPALKGEVPPVGTLNIVKGCSFIPLLNDKAIILLFLNALDEPVSHENAILVALSTDEPGYRWVAQWLAESATGH